MLGMFFLSSLLVLTAGVSRTLAINRAGRTKCDRESKTCHPGTVIVAGICISGQQKLICSRER